MVDIKLTYEDGTTLEQIVAFEVAAQIWESHLEDDVTINIHAEVTDELGAYLLGGALPAFVTGVDYTDFEAALIADATSDDDNTAVANLPTEDKGEITIFAHGEEDLNPDQINITRANAKAIGLAGINPHSTELDAFIAINDLSVHPDYQWSYDPNASTIAADELDFVSVALHEMGHALGFTSGLDDPGWLEALQDGYDSKKGTIKIEDADSDIGNPLDLFRFSGEGIQESKGDGQDWSIGADSPYFSIDGGNTSLAEFSTGDEDVDQDGTLEGDGYQASHWKHNIVNPAGIFDPALINGVRRNVTNLDLTALDVIGWDRSASSSNLDFSIRFEAEDLPFQLLTQPSHLAFSQIQSIAGASGGQVWSLDDDQIPNDESIDQIGELTINFNGPSGLYDVVIGYYDEEDGVASYEVRQDSTLLDSWDADLQLGSDTATDDTLWRRTNATSLQVSTGDVFTFKATQGLDDHARIDFIDFIAKDFTGDLSTGSGSGSGGTPIRIEDTEFINVEHTFDTDHAGGTGSWVLHPNYPANVSVVFNGPAGFYDVDIAYFDANGSAYLEVKKGSTILDAWTLNNDELFWTENLISRNIASNIEVNPGDTFSFSGTGNPVEYAVVDYLDFTPTASIPSPQTVRVEAEDMTLNTNSNYAVEDLSIASGGKVAKSANYNGYGEFNFAGDTGVYDIVVGFFDENDGVGQIRVKQNGVHIIDSPDSFWHLDQDLGSAEPNANTFVTETVVSGVQITNGDLFRLTMKQDGGEYARVDYIDFVPTAPPPEIVRFEAEDMTLNTNSNYAVEDLSIASGGKVAKSANYNGYGEFNFDGDSGVYDIVVGFFDENDGVGQIRVKQNGVNIIDSPDSFWHLEQDLGSAEPDANTFVTETVVSGVQITNGDLFRLTMKQDGGEYARVDYIDFVPTGSSDSGGSGGSGSGSGGSGSGGSGGSGQAPQSVLETYQDAAISHIASELGWTEQQVRDSLSNVNNSITDSRFSEVAIDILSGYGNGWGSSGSGSSGGGWGGGSCGWGCQDFEELFYSHAFGAVINDGDDTHDHDHVDDLTGTSDGDTQPRFSRPAKYSGTNPTRNGRQGLKKRAYSGQRLFNQDSSEEIADSINDLEADFFQSSARSTSVNSNQPSPSLAYGLDGADTGLDGTNHLLMTNNADIIEAVL